LVEIADAVPMLRAPDPNKNAADPLVRKASRNARTSSLLGAAAVLIAGLTTIVAVNIAYSLRFEDAAGAAAFSAVLAIGGFTFATVLGWLALRMPVRAERQQAEALAEAYRALEDSTLETFAALNAAVEAKDRYTAGHGLRVTLVSILIGQELGLPEDDLDVLRRAATFHDIGKIAVPDEVLSKPGRLTDEEFEQMKVHPVESARICTKVAALRDAVPAIRHHHERVDGRGYPDQLAGADIPLGARIIAVADTWDAITSDRPYRKGQHASIALAEIRRSSGTQLDEAVVLAFLEVLSRDPWMFGLEPEDLDVRPTVARLAIDASPRSTGREDGTADLAA
jgi:hypothetical protein